MHALRALDVPQLRVCIVACPFCGRSLLLRLNAKDAGVRCLRCAASSVHLSIGIVLRRRFADFASLDACEFSSRGPLVDFLRKRCRSLRVSEYFASVEPGSLVDGVRCEDMQALTYADESFDLVTHTEVLEHVPDEGRALRELRRVLRPGGTMVFTVPLHPGAHTIERARLVDGEVRHLEEPVHHVDPLRDGARILAFRDYGMDLPARLLAHGYSKAEIVQPDIGVSWACLRPVVIASV